MKTVSTVEGLDDFASSGYLGHLVHHHDVSLYHFVGAIKHSDPPLLIACLMLGGVICAATRRKPVLIENGRLQVAHSCTVLPGPVRTVLRRTVDILYLGVQVGIGSSLGFTPQECLARISGPDPSQSD